jgi:hypothetical protein
MTWTFSIVSRLFCAFWAYYVFTEHEKRQSGQPDVSHLLNRAARLETIDSERAIKAYEEIVQNFPSTSAAHEAERNIEVLRKTTNKASAGV